MICVKALVRQVEAGEHSRALSRVLENGRAAEKQLQHWLRVHPREMAVVALGLALTRLAELTYGPTDEGSRLADRLIRSQNEDGSFGETAGASQGNPVSTAVALAGLLFHLDQYAQISLEPGDALTQAVDRAARALVEWIVAARGANHAPDELAIVRSQLDATAVLGITASDMLHELSATAATPAAQSVAA